MSKITTLRCLPNWGADFWISYKDDEENEDDDDGPEVNYLHDDELGAEEISK